MCVCVCVCGGGGGGGGVKDQYRCPHAVLIMIHDL